MAVSGERSSPLRKSTWAARPCAAAATRALNAAAPRATALPRKPTSMAEVRAGSRRMPTAPSSSSIDQGWVLPPDGALAAASATAATASRVAPGTLWTASGSGGGPSETGSRISPSSAGTSTRTRPDGSGSPSPIRRTASATEAAPTATSDDSCGHVVNVLPTSIKEAAIRDGSSAASITLRTRGTLSLVLSPASRAASMSPSRPCRTGRSGSASKRSTSSRPPLLVAINTGMPCARAAVRTSTLASRESHSSTTMSSPSRKSSTVSAVSPAGTTSTGR